ncbi:uncharacterized protein A4U43_C06F10420 [Asparagus officinalis]|uniref:Uncharacterized protein n=1 Tax=Asparagus officinalis TaxID=4686 RepID=A0A5P1ENB7_ASPOF|nr:uncharacterized protein A4U43_C06F10420 [Asparagus officinalis]
MTWVIFEEELGETRGGGYAEIREDFREGMSIWAQGPGTGTARKSGPIWALGSGQFADAHTGPGPGPVPKGQA